MIFASSMIHILSLTVIITSLVCPTYIHSQFRIFLVVVRDFIVGFTLLDVHFAGHKAPKRRRTRLRRHRHTVRKKMHRSVGEPRFGGAGHIQGGGGDFQGQ